MKEWCFLKVTWIKLKEGKGEKKGWVQAEQESSKYEGKNWLALRERTNERYMSFRVTKVDINPVYTRVKKG